MNDSSCVFEIIEKTVSTSENRLSISSLCKMAGVSRSGYYAWVKAEAFRQAQQEQDRKEFELILAAYKRRGYKKGARSIYMELLHMDPPVIMNVKKIRRLMKKFHDSLEVDFVVETVNNLIRDHGVSLHAETIVHSDQGCHYTSHSFIDILHDKDLRQSMSRRGNCWDNAPQESFFGRMKDHVKKKIAAAVSFGEVKAIVDDYMDYYNNERYQWELAKLSPNEFYQFVTTGVYPLDIPKMPEVPTLKRRACELGNQLTS